MYDDFIRLATELMKDVKQGDGAQEGITMGPCINQESIDCAQAHVDDAVKHGAVVKCGGGRPKHLSEGYFFEPTLLAGATTAMRVFKEETFSPVLAVIKCALTHMTSVVVRAHEAWKWLLILGILDLHFLIPILLHPCYRSQTM